MIHKSIHKSSIVSYSCKEMYALVSDIPNYHRFLPYCSAAEILSEQGNIVHGKMVFTYLGLSYSLITKNSMRPYSRIGLSLLRGDMQALDGQWLFNDLQDGRCEVSLDLEIDMHEGMFYRLYNRIIDKLADTMVDRFVERAYEVYGFGDD